MFYEIELQDHIRVPPTSFSLLTDEAILSVLKKRFENYVSKEIGIVIGVSEITYVGEGIIIHGDGAAYYDSKFKVLSYKPEVQEVVLGRIRDITDFGAFIDIGSVDGMIHVSQTMDDYVSFSKSGVLTGKESKKVLKVGDPCRARVIAVSYKELLSPKIGLTMRQPFLGCLKWIKDDLKKLEKEIKK